MLSDYLIKDGVVLEPIIGNKWRILEYLTEYYCKGIEVIGREKIFETVLNREMIVSTGLGGGVALPHARTDVVERTGVLFARFKDGIEWNSMDGSEVKFLFLIIGPASSTKEYLYVLSKISKMLSRKTNRKSLLHSKNQKEILQVFAQVKDRENSRISK